jgi:hypothetical protein
MRNIQIPLQFKICCEKKFFSVHFISHFRVSINTYQAISKFPNWPPGVRTANGTAFCSDTRCNCIAILSVSLVSFAAVTLCVASQGVFIVVSVYFIIDSVRKLLDKLSYMTCIKSQLNFVS